MTPSEVNDVSRYSSRELIVGGDWAVSHNHPGSLALIARQLATRVRAEERDQLFEAARLLERDGSGAAAMWYAATAGIRRRDHQPGPRRDDPPGRRGEAMQRRLLRAGRER